jgi:hypothetical protein
MIKAYKNYEQLLHAWIYGDESFEGYTTNRRLFAEGNNLYSYRYGAMIAKKLDNQTILVDTRKFSVTTSKQQRLLQRAIPFDWNVIYVEDPSQTPKVLIQRSINKFKEHLAKIKNSRVNKLIFLNDANYERLSGLALALIFPEQCTLANFRWLENRIEATDYIDEAWLKKHEEKEANHILKQQKEDEFRALKGEEQLEKWLNFEANSCYSYTGLTRLRYDEKTQKIKTTLGITIHKDKVKELYDLLKENKSVLGLKIDNTYTVKAITEDILTIGCHKLDIKQLLTFGSRVFKNENFYRSV